MTFIVVVLLLCGADLQVAIPWVDTVLHKIFPVVVAIDWLIDRPTMPLTFRQSPLWVTYPLVWVVCTLIRGAIENWYPNPFLNPANGGYRSVAVYAVAILIAFFVISAITVALGNAMRVRDNLLRPHAGLEVLCSQASHYPRGTLFGRRDRRTRA